MHLSRRVSPTVPRTTGCAIVGAFGVVLAWNGIQLVRETWYVATPILSSR